MTKNPPVEPFGGPIRKPRQTSGPTTAVHARPGKDSAGGGGASKVRGSAEDTTVLPRDKWWEILP